VPVRPGMKAVEVLDRVRKSGSPRATDRLMTSSGKKEKKKILIETL
jgi:hypothetical protein